MGNLDEFVLDAGAEPSANATEHEPYGAADVAAEQGYFDALEVIQAADPTESGCDAKVSSESLLCLTHPKGPPCVEMELRH